MHGTVFDRKKEQYDKEMIAFIFVSQNLHFNECYWNTNDSVEIKTNKNKAIKMEEKQDQKKRIKHLHFWICFKRIQLKILKSFNV